jgi:hypothetical protein
MEVKWVRTIDGINVKVLKFKPHHGFVFVDGKPNKNIVFVSAAI